MSEEMQALQTSPARPFVLPKKRNCENGNKSWFKSGVAQTEKHGMSNSLTYKVWSGILSRCNTPSASGYENYGARGIGVCERWLKFENFLSDMGEKPSEMSIDRIDTNGNYEPGNCRWSSRKEQNRNKRGLRYLTYNARTQCLSAWAEEVGVNVSSLLNRIKAGWTVSKALETPIRPHKEYSNARA